MNLFVGTFKRYFWEFKRYFANTISSIVVIFIIYTMIILGMKNFGSSTALEMLGGTAVGYFVWTVVLVSLTDLSWTIMSEMQRGIIEQEFLSPFGPLTVFMMYEISGLLISLPLIYGIMVLMFWMAGLPILLPPSFFIFLLLLMVQSYGISFILAGLTLKFKRTNALLQLIQFAVIGLLFFKPSGVLSIIVPISPFFHVMNGIVEGKSPGLGDYVLCIAASLLWTAIGTYVFGVFEKNVRKLGSLSIY